MTVGRQDAAPGEGSSGHPGEPAPGSVVRPGALTQLLADLVKAPAGAGWELPLQPGEAVGRFEVVREIGRGGFGVVYEARDRELSRSVAFKALRAGTATAGGQAVAEAEAAARLAHPNIVHLYDLGHGERGAWLIMELMRGRSLADRLAEGPLPLGEAVRVAVEVSRGLAHAHQQGVVHRDLKPSNVFLCDDGQVKVLDFGLAQVFGKAGVAGGTPAYMAPEQAAGAPGDERSDVYSLGVMVRELLTGMGPLTPSTASGPGEATASNEPAAPVRRTPSALTRLVTALTSQDPAGRPASGAEVLAALLPIQKSLEPKRLIWASAFLVAIAFGSALAFAFFWQRPLPPGPLLTALADTDNQTGDADLDGLSELLRTGLEQSRRVTVMARSRLMKLLGEAGGAVPGSIGEAEARSVARRAQASLLIVPAIRRLGGGHTVEVRAIDLGRSQPLFTVRESAGGKGSIPEALDRLIDRVRAELHEDPQDAPRSGVRLAQALPSNPEAWHHYAEAQRLRSEAKPGQALAAYRRALQADPEFPLVHALLADDLAYFDASAAQEHYDVAMKHLDRIPPLDRLLLEASRASVEGRMDVALARWDQAIGESPQALEPYFRAGQALQRMSEPAAARPYLEKTLELGGLPPRIQVDILVDLGRSDEALAFTRRWSEQSPGALSFGNLSFVLRHRGELGPALEAARRVVAEGVLPSSDGATFWTYVEAGGIDELEQLYRRRGESSSDLLALRGRVGAALAELDAGLRKQLALERPSGSSLEDTAVAARAVYHASRVGLFQTRGEPELMWREVEAQLALGSTAASCSGAALAEVGQLERASRLMGLFAATDPRLYCNRLFRHLREWKQGEAEAAARGLAAMYGAAPVYYLGLVLGELGRDREAVAAFRRYRRSPAWNNSAEVYYPRTLYLEAAALERLGEKEEARQVIARLLHLWERADADLPLLAEARALGTRLAAR